ncbi:Chromosome partition protein Smc [bacterium YEK0313]|nr:Chromosome partition protein Smc [bacterium YEK0313]
MAEQEPVAAAGIEGLHRLGEDGRSILPQDIIVDDPVLDRLMRPDRAAELTAGTGMGDRHVPCPLGEAEQFRGDPEPGRGQDVGRQLRRDPDRCIGPVALGTVEFGNGTGRIEGLAFLEPRRLDQPDFHGSAIARRSIKDHERPRPAAVLREEARVRSMPQVTLEHRDEARAGGGPGDQIDQPWLGAAAEQRQQNDIGEIGPGRERPPDLAGNDGGLAQAEAEAAEAEQAHAEARDLEAEARRPLADAERQVQHLDTEARTLAKVLNVAHDSAFPPVLEAIRVAKGYETALGAALGDDLDAPTAADSPQRWGGADATGDAALPAGVEPLAAHVDAPLELARRLAQIGVVAKADGARLAKSLLPGQRLVSRDGDLWRWDGFVVAANAPTAAARRLAERNRLVDIERDLVAARETVVALKATVEEAVGAVKMSAQREQAARDGWRAAQRAADGVRDQLAGAERAAAGVVTRRATLAEARARLSASIEEAATVKDDAVRAFDNLDRLDHLEKALGETRTEVAQHRAVLAEARAYAQGLAREAEMRTRRLGDIMTDRKAWLDRQANSGRQIADLERRLGEAREEAQTLADAPDTFVEQRRSLIGRIQDAEAAQKTAADRLTAGETTLAEADRAARSALDSMAGAREALVRAEGRHEAAQTRMRELEQEIVEKFDSPPAALAKIAELAPEAELPPARDLEEALDRLKREREKLGGVNLRADDELNEIQTQFDGMTRERDDLVEAIKKLRAGIGSLNREGRERLLASFAMVNENFQRLFTTLFGGGTAELQLIESDDPLEAGLDILARPPGKKPQTLSLLSGGEQALTAIALIFAVFLTNPAPICVLDEVDAPLDDANVERYCDLLQEMARTTQTRFVVITHNPITMARMNRLFGVTMAERGISTLVSVNLDRAEQLIAAE